MALGTVRGGRPCAVAVMPFQNARKVGLLEEFYSICSAFHYREIMALSRVLSVSPRTVENWKYGLTFPRWDIAVDIIEWAKQGKPIVMMPPSEAATNMM